MSGDPTPEQMKALMNGYLVCPKCKAKAIEDGICNVCGYNNLKEPKPLLEIISTLGQMKEDNKVDTNESDKGNNLITSSNRFLNDIEDLKVFLLSNYKRPVYNTDVFHMVIDIITSQNTTIVEKDSIIAELKKENEILQDNLEDCYGDMVEAERGAVRNNLLGVETHND